MQPAIFLDRDGVIVENRADYIKDWSEVAFIPGALEAMQQLGKSRYAIVLVSNQSAIGRGVISLAKAQEINQAILQTIRDSGGRVDAAYLCPHAPWEDCICRKPRPGLLLRAAEDLSLSLVDSIMIGDAVSDLQAGFAAGAGRVVLVLTGRGAAQSVLPEAQTLPPYDIYQGLSEFVKDLSPSVFSGE